MSQSASERNKLLYLTHWDCSWNSFWRTYTSGNCFHRFSAVCLSLTTYVKAYSTFCGESFTHGHLTCLFHSGITLSLYNALHHLLLPSEIYHISRSWFKFLGLATVYLSWICPKISAWSWDIPQWQWVSTHTSYNFRLKI